MPSAVRKQGGTKRRAPADATITMRVPAQTRDLIDRAAASLGKSRTEFMIESARGQAVDLLLDQRVFDLNEDQDKAFAAMLADPPRPVAALRELMAGKPPWR